MIVHGVRASIEVVGDDADGVSDDELVEDLVFAIGEPGFGVGHMFEGGFGFAREEREELAQGLCELVD